MGYSVRYHAASLAAVFLALAIGILVGAEFGGEVLSDTRRSLERSLMENLEDSREEIDELASELERSRSFAQRIYPTLVGDRLYGDRVALIGLGGLDPRLVDDVEEALEPTGGELVGIGVLRRPPEIESIQRELGHTREGAAVNEPEGLTELGGLVARQLAAGGGPLQRMRGEFFSRASGSFRDLDQVIVAWSEADPDSLEPEELEATEMLERGLMRGLSAGGIEVVGVERTDTEPSTVAYFTSLNVASVDNVNETAGRVALVLALRGAQGAFGIKETADSLLPDLIPTPGGFPPEAVDGS